MIMGGQYSRSVRAEAFDAPLDCCMRHLANISRSRHSVDYHPFHAHGGHYYDIGSEF